MAIIETKHHLGTSTLFCLGLEFVIVSVNKILKHFPEFIQTSVHLCFSVWRDLCNRCHICVRLVPVCVSESESYCTSLVTFSVALASCCATVAVSMEIGLATDQTGNAQSALCRVACHKILNNLLHLT